MNTVKVMSIIGLILFIVSLFCILNFMGYENEAAIGWGIIALLYGIPYSIVGIAKGIKYKKQKKPISELRDLNELKEEGIITEDEFLKKKKEYI